MTLHAKGLRQKLMLTKAFYAKEKFLSNGFAHNLLCTALLRAALSYRFSLNIFKFDCKKEKKMTPAKMLDFGKTQKMKKKAPRDTFLKKTGLGHIYRDSRFVNVL